ncbi:MAG: hypothetical protein COA40_12525 [Aequorivita sp.]|nr:MAG: hypothetical protein COA40_12525 [Aequorivita sp.]
MTGKLLHTLIINGTKTSLNLSTLKSGVYICEIKSDTKTEIRKIIKK